MSPVAKVVLYQSLCLYFLEKKKVTIQFALRGEARVMQADKIQG